MPAYMIARIEITDSGRYSKYLAATPAIIARFGGRFIARGGETVVLEGPEENRRIAVVEFPDLKSARDFYNSAEYRKARKLREDAAQISLIAVDGV
jgi:uncharacterized protein (DUF1330 family)